jgi:hypothetical protein
MCEACTAPISEAFANQRKQSNFQLLNPMILRWTHAEMWCEVLVRVEQFYALLAVIRLSCCICRFVVNCGPGGWQGCNVVKEKIGVIFCSRKTCPHLQIDESVAKKSDQKTVW